MSNPKKNLSNLFARPSVQAKKMSYLEKQKLFWKSKQNRKRAIAGYLFIFPVYLLFVIFY
ncbi:hypothetical protein ACI2OX_08295 [Bacillus sp. N9]